jgi:hypothetical protein
MGIVDNALMGASGQSGYNLTRSLRFRSSASASLTRTFGTPTNNKIWTLSFWVKRGTITSRNLIASTNTSGGTDGFYLDWDTDVLEIGQYTTSWVWQLQTTQIFRDPSAWYHIVYAVDTTQATAANRVKLYVNGTEVTAFRTASYPTQNLNTLWNQSAQPARFGYSASAAISFDAYLAEVNFIDGQALTPSSFGSTNALTGVWQPAAYTGSYGTNGFELQFTDNSAATAAAIGKDFSGNGNNWTPNNISVTAGATYDSMTDVPTLTSATAANFAVLNPLRSTVSGGFSNGNLTGTCESGVAGRGLTSTITLPWTGKWYAEATPSASNAYNWIGITAVDLFTLATDAINTPGQQSVLYYALNGNKYVNNAASSYGASYTTETIGIAFDGAAGTVTFYKANVSQGAITLPSSTVNYVFCQANAAGQTSSINWNFGQRPFAYTPPTGFVALNTFNLPTSTIVKGNTVMDATLWTGTAPTPQTISGLQFRPDLVWVKNRSYPADHYLVDSVRGASNGLRSNSTSAEVNNNSVTAFTSNGFTVGTIDAVGRAAGPDAVVGWTWNAGSGSTSSNTNGTITSTVSVNASAGFSVVTFTSQASGAGTIGHGLGIAPKLIIVKDRGLTSNWATYHSSVTTATNLYLTLNTTGALAAISGVWGSALPTSSVFGITSGTTVQASDTCVAYCWAEIDGFSKFGSYTGNGSADGPFVYLGFRPKFVLYKDTANGSTNWELVDSARNTYNPEFTRLFPNASNADDNAVNPVMDFTANGFKIRTSAFGVNNNGNVHIYMAFAETPTKFSLAR